MNKVKFIIISLIIIVLYMFGVHLFETRYGGIVNAVHVAIHGKPTPTLTYTLTPTPTLTPTLTRTPTSTLTPTLTWTQEPTNTSTPTITMTPTLIWPPPILPTVIPTPKPISPQPVPKALLGPPRIVSSYIDAAGYLHCQVTGDYTGLAVYCEIHIPNPVWGWQPKPNLSGLNSIKNGKVYGLVIVDGEDPTYDAFRVRLVPDPGWGR